jgi:hypothetical protein
MFRNCQTFWRLIVNVTRLKPVVTRWKTQDLLTYAQYFSGVQWYEVLEKRGIGSARAQKPRAVYKI